MRLIDADALKKEVGKLWEELDDVDFGELVRDFWKILNKFPTIDAEPVRHGQWVMKKERFLQWYACSECGSYPPRQHYASEIRSELTPYCPNCGAKMDGGENE